jgi:tRNA(Ile)-lysidine synthase
MNNYTSIVTNKVISAINDNNMLECCDEVVVGFSGGADSVCLLHVLFSLSQRLGFTVKAAHVNHGIRGDEAKRDEVFSNDFCSRYGIMSHLHTFNCVDEANQSGESLEECGRRVRYNYFNSLVGEHGKIATAHNANDNAETVLFNLARGTALKGACGIPCVRDNIIRPLIYCTRREIELYCEENKLEYITDSTNLSDDYSRNKIRHKILPVLTEINSCAIENINAFCVGTRQVEAYIHSEAEECLCNAKVSKDTYDIHCLQNCSKVLLKEFICIAYDSFSDKTLDRRKIDEIVSLIFSSGRLQLYGNEYVEVVKKTLRFFRKDSYKQTEAVSVNGV